MDPVTSVVIGICLCVCLCVLLVNCVHCHRKLSEEQLQQKYFEKFRKKHMKARDRVLTNRVDVIRSRTESQASSDCEKEHTYQTIESVSNQVIPCSDIVTMDDHSFFDESFQTVIEASSYNTTNYTENKSSKNFLSASANLASYISFRQLHNSSTTPILDPSETDCSGEINPAFSRESSHNVDTTGHVLLYNSPRCHRGQRSQSPGSISDDYVSPNLGPRICVTEATINRGNNKRRNKDSHLVSSIEKGPEGLNLPLSQDRVHESLRVGNLSASQTSKIGRELDFDMRKQRQEDVRIHLNNPDSVDPVLKQKYLERIQTEGMSHCHSPRYGPKKRAGKTKLVIPRSDFTCVDTLDEDDHTYESITSVLTEGATRPDSEGMVSECSGVSNAAVKPSVSDNDHTYESITSKMGDSFAISGVKHVIPDLPVNSVDVNRSGDTGKPHRKNGSDSDTAVVIIGRKVSTRYRPILPADNSNSDFRPTNVLSKKLFDSFKSPVKSRRDSLERYSPFPSAKKLAFKSPFKQVASPHYRSMQVKSGHLKPTFYTELLNSASKNIGIENFNINTPELKIKESPKIFTIDSTVFLLPMDCLHKPVSDTHENKLGTVNSPQMFLHSPITGFVTKQTGPIRQSLPSLPDDLDLVLENHCNACANANSTPMCN